MIRFGPVKWFHRGEESLEHKPTTENKMENLTAVETLAIAFYSYEKAEKAVMNFPARSAERYEAIDKAEELDEMCVKIKSRLRKTMGIANADKMIREARALAATF